VRLEAAYAILENEYNVYRRLTGGISIPCVYGIEFDKDYALVLDLLGPSLEDLFNRCERKFSLKTILLLAVQLMYRIEYIYAKSYIHSDIKPANCLMGISTDKKQVSIIDFGLAKGTVMKITFLAYSVRTTTLLVMSNMPLLMFMIDLVSLSI
jgi:casein kinase I homolog HRR25